MNSGKVITSVLLFVFLASQVTVAQVTTGTILGTVTDSTGAVVPGATVTVRNVETGISRTLTTDATGRYRAPQLGLGTYEVTAEVAGFQTVVRSGITLTVGREAAVDFTLQVGAVAERITVTGEAPLIETTNATVGSLVDEGTMRDLPLRGRSFADLTAIQPGVISDMPYGSGGTSLTFAVYTGGGTAARRSIGGTKPQHATYFLDGIELSTPSEGTPVSSVLGEQLGVDAIREFSVLQFNYGAQTGRAAGGVVNAVIRSGTNEFHGTVFEFLRNDATDARAYFLHPKFKKEPLRRNQFGVSVGGPLQKDRTFFFLNYEGIRQAAGASKLFTTLTPETKQGRITGCPAGRASCPKGEAIVTQVLPVHPDIKPLLNLLPLPNGDYRGAGVGELFFIERYGAHENFGVVRIDRQISEKDSLFGRLTVDRSARTDQFALLAPGGFRGIQLGGYVLAALSETHIFSPTVLNTFRVGYTRRNDAISTNYSIKGDKFPQGDPNLDPRLSPVKGVPLGLFAVPGVGIGGTGGVGPSLFGPAIFVDNTFDYEDSLSISRGRHTITVGANLKRFRTNEANEPWVYGLFSWLTLERFITNRPFTTTQVIRSLENPVIGDAYRGWRQTYGAAYFQDDFQVLSNLTLNLGVRWERVSGPREVNGKLAVLKDVYRDRAFAVLGKDDTLFTTDNPFGGFLPRFGFAWTPVAAQGLAFRGGLGIFKEIPLQYIYQLNLDAPGSHTRLTVNDPVLKFPFPFEDTTRIAGKGEPLLSPSIVELPYVLQWTFSLERQLGETFVIKANYVGTRGINQFNLYNPNHKPTQLVNGRPFVPANAQPPNPNFTSFAYIAPSGDQYYHAGQLVVEKRFSGGLRFNSSYTWSRNIDTVPTGMKCGEVVTGTANAAYGWDYDLKSSRALSSLNIQHNWISSYTYELPFGSGRRWGGQWSGALDRLLSGWTISGTSTIRTGLPVQIGMSPRQSRCIGGCGERPDLRPGGNNNPVRENWTPESYFDPSQFLLPELGYHGNVGRHTLIRPGQLNMNVSVTKDNRLWETGSLAFRAEFFNFLNRPNFGHPTANIFRDAAGHLDPNVGRINYTASEMRQIQFGLKLTF